MPFEMQKVNTSPAMENDLNGLNEELHLLEVETFEIEDLSDLSQNPAIVRGSCSCTSSCCSCTSTSSCSSSA